MNTQSTHNAVAGIEGYIDIRMQGASHVDIQSYRTTNASQVFISQPPQKVLDIAPLLFSICGIAQTSAAVHAMHAAKDIPVTNPQLIKAQSIFVQVETARESLLKLLHNIPLLLDMTNHQQAAFTYIGQLVPSFKSVLFQNGSLFSMSQAEHFDIQQDSICQLSDDLDAFITEYILGMPAERFLDFTHADDLNQWISRHDTLATRITQKILAHDWASQGHTDSPCLPLPEIQLDTIANKLGSDEADTFIQQPVLDDSHYETGIFARQWDNPLIKALRKQTGTGLLSRWMAKLIELAKTTGQIRQLLQGDNHPDIQTASTRDGLGIASIEAARGRLIHLSEIHDDKITDYRILAPTEWNFHPQGTVFKCLSAIQSSSTEERKTLADFLIHVIDPCVTYKLEVS